MTVKISQAFKNYVRPSEHSTFSPSAADRWMNCFWSIKGSKGIPEQKSKWAEEGTIAHTVCEDYANHYFFEHEQTQALKEATDENLQSAQGWVEVLSSWINRPDELGDILLFDFEVPLPIFPERECFGTADAVIVGTKGCAIIDYKNGVGHSVGARTPQLQVYLLSIFRYVENLPEDYRFNAVIYQPRLDDLPKEATYTYEEMQIFEQQVSDAIDHAGRLDIEPVMGNHCYWCPANRTTDPSKKCPAQNQKVIDLAGAEFDKYLADISAPIDKVGAPNVKRDEALIKLMSLKPLIDSVVKDALFEFRERLERGEEIKGVEIREKLGNRQWAMGEEDIAARLKELYAIETHIQQKPKLKTITQVEKEVGKKNLVSSLTVRPVTKEVALCEKSVKEILGDMANYGRQFIE